MKELERYTADLEVSIEQEASVAVRKQISQSKRLLAGMRERYDTFVQEIQASRIVKLTSEDAVVLHMARVFGETELDLPDDFVAEVKRYIRKWQATPRLARAIRRVNENSYAAAIPARRRRIAPRRSAALGNWLGTKPPSPRRAALRCLAVSSPHQSPRARLVTAVRARRYRARARSAAG